LILGRGGCLEGIGVPVRRWVAQLVGLRLIVVGHGGAISLSSFRCQVKKRFLFSGMLDFEIDSVSLPH
jgi:hypothetical protein